MQTHCLTCTFCKRSEHQVRKLVAGPGVYICDACVEVAHRIVSEARPPASSPSRWRRIATRARSTAEGLRRRFLQHGLRHAV